MNLLFVISQLLQASLKGCVAGDLPGMGEAEWKLLLGVCAAQNIHTLVYDALPDTVPDSVMTVWRNQVRASERRCRLLERVQNVQEELWKSRGLSYALLKGSTLAALYPHPEHRGSGDIDWYFADGQSWEEAAGLARGIAENGLNTDSDGDLNYAVESVVVEHHRNWSHLSSGKLRRLCGRAVINEGRLSPEDTLLTLECHILHHLAYKGLGLKQFVDLAVARAAYEGKYDVRSYDERLEKLGLSRWHRLLDAALGRLGLGPEQSSDYGDDAGILVDVALSDGCVSTGKKTKITELLRRAALMFKYHKRECISRYASLLKGNFCK